MVVVSGNPNLTSMIEIKRVFENNTNNVTINSYM